MQTAEMNSKKATTTKSHPTPMPPIPRERKSLQHVAKKNPASPKHNNIPVPVAESAHTSNSLQTTQQQPIPKRTKEKVELDDVKVSNINMLPIEKVAEQHVMSAQNVDGDGVDMDTGRAEHEISLESNDAGETRNR